MTLNRSLFALLAVSCFAACETETADEVVEASGERTPPPINFAFVERFEELDENFWLVSDGWTNGDWMDTAFLADQLAVGPDGLTMTLARADGRVAGQPYVSGELRTLGEYDGGYFEIDMQVPKGDGLVTGFFTYTGPFFGDPQDEIDIEILGKDTTTGMFTIFDDGASKSTYVPLGFDAAEGFHVYGFEWTPEHIRWYVDGTLLHEETGVDFPLPTTAQNYFLNLWNSSSLSDWLGALDRGAIPQTLRVACMAQAPRYEGRSLCRGS